jgi:hypothetical protein
MQAYLGDGVSIPSPSLQTHSKNGIYRRAKSAARHFLIGRRPISELAGPVIMMSELPIVSSLRRVTTRSAQHLSRPRKRWPARVIHLVNFDDMSLEEFKKSSLRQW